MEAVALGFALPRSMASGSAMIRPAYPPTRKLRQKEAESCAMGPVVPRNGATTLRPGPYPMRSRVNALTAPQSQEVLSSEGGGKLNGRFLA